MAILHKIHTALYRRQVVVSEISLYMVGALFAAENGWIGCCYRNWVAAWVLGVLYIIPHPMQGLLSFVGRYMKSSLTVLELTLEHDRNSCIVLRLISKSNYSRYISKDLSTRLKSRLFFIVSTERTNFSHQFVFKASTRLADSAVRWFLFSCAQHWVLRT